MNPDRVARALAALPRFDAGERRAARTRALCHADLQRPRPPADRDAASPVALGILQPLAVAGCLVFLAMMLSQAARIVGISLW